MEKMYRVLLACGNEDYGKVLASTFQLTDRYIVAGSAKDGAEALDMLRDTRPDFLVMDLMLQKTDGMSVLKAAAALDRHPVMLVLVEFVTEYISSMFMELGVARLIRATVVYTSFSFKYSRNICASGNIRPCVRQTPFSRKALSIHGAYRELNWQNIFGAFWGSAPIPCATRSLTSSMKISST